MMKLTTFLLLLLYCHSVYANNRMTSISKGVKIYSEYYPNENSKYQGTIVFENGSGTDLTEWTQNKSLFLCLQKLGSLFFYDRNGLGKSPPDLNVSAKNPVTAKFIGRKFSQLLKMNKLKPPYLIVSHSYGAMYAGYFATTYPNMVSGMFMVDPVPKNFDFSDKKWKDYELNLNLVRTHSAKEVYLTIPGDTAEVAYEFLGFQETKNEVQKLGAIIPKIPVVILSSTGMQQENPIKGNWLEQQKQWLNQNPLSSIKTITAGHFIQLDKPSEVCAYLANLITSITP